MCSFQTSTVTRLMLLVKEKMGAAALDELLVFWRLSGGEVVLLVAVVVSDRSLVDIF